MQPRLGIGVAIKLFDADRLEGRRPLDGSQPVGEGRETVEVVSRVVVVLVGLMVAVVAVGAGYAVLLVVALASLSLGSILLAMVVVDAGSKIAAVEVDAKIWAVDLLVRRWGRIERLELDCAR